MRYVYAPHGICVNERITHCCNVFSYTRIYNILCYTFAFAATKSIVTSRPIPFGEEVRIALRKSV